MVRTLLSLQAPRVTSLVRELKFCQDALTRGHLIRAFLSHWGHDSVQLWVLSSGLQVQKSSLYEGVRSL